MEKKTYVVYEFCANRSLRHMVQDRGTVPEDAASPIFVQLAGAIKYIHSQGVMHRDLKLENIFLDKDGNVKVGDFSHAAYTQQNNSARAVCGTLGYMAPEMFTGEKGFGVDLWSLGVIL
jgi:cell cycle serine/threonine-protein kinase CDC5/MSD2